MSVKYLIPVFALVIVFGAVVLMENDSDAAVVNPSTGTQVGDLYYTVSDNTASVVGVSSASLTAISVPDTVNIGSVDYNVVSISANSVASSMGELQTVSIGDNVISISDGAFRNCSKLATVSIGRSLTTIGSSAFGSCSMLQSFSVSNDNPAFFSDDGVLFDKNKTTLIIYPVGKTQSTYNIPSTVTAISDSAFNYCTNLSTILFPEGLTSIGRYAFAGCSNLSSVTLPESLLTIGDSGFSGCSGISSIIIPDHVTSIGKNAFKNCMALTSVTLGASVTSIGISGSVTDSFPATITTLVIRCQNVGNNWFYNFNSLTSLTFEDTVLSIGSSFQKCNSIESVVIPDSVTSINEYAFSQCASLYTVTIGKSVTTFGSGTAWNSPHPFTSAQTLIIRCVNIGSYWFRSAGATTVILEDTVESIGSTAFTDCTRLSSLDLGNSVTVIGNGAFYSCSSLESIVIPDSVTSIGSDAFSMCSSLKKVHIGNSVQKIDSLAFRMCDIEKIVIPASVTTLKSDAFLQNSNLKEILNLSAVNMTGQYSGVTIRTGENGIDSLTMLQEVGEPERTEVVTTPKDGPLPVILGLIPIVLIVGLALGVVAFFRFKN